MTLCAYIDVRPWLFLVGLPIFIALTVLGCRLARARLSAIRAGIVSALAFIGLFTVFLTDYGPFLGETERREYLMTWEIRSPQSDNQKAPEVVLSFVDFPGHHIGEYSEFLADHLETQASDNVNVVFEVTLNYGKVKGFNPIEISGLTHWRSEGSYAGVSGSPSRSPWE